MILPKLDANAVLSPKDGDAAIRHKLAIERLRQNLTPGESGEKRLRGACEGFESIFINKLWKQMRASVPKEGYLHSKEEEIYLSMFDVEVSKKMSSAGGIGLGDLLFEQLQQQLSDAGSKTSNAKHKGLRGVKPLSGVSAERAKIGEESARAKAEPQEVGDARDVKTTLSGADALARAMDLADRIEKGSKSGREIAEQGHK
ncbi:MAG: rod-binding protein [Thermodesulfobacteriota bacterium]|nr:rod-binding protein [Thermodesulfobacteriota bacterium]